VIEGSAGSVLLGTILKRAFYKTLMYALQQIPSSSKGTSWAVVLGMHGTHCKHCSLIPPLVSNNNLALLRCGYMCAGTLVRISKHLCKMSNNKKKDANCVSVVCFAEYAFIGFYIRFLIYDHYYIIAAYILLCHLCYIPPISCPYLIIP